MINTTKPESLLSMNLVRDNFLYSADIGNKNLWVVLSQHGPSNLDRIENILMNKYRLIDSKQFKKLNLYKFQKKK